MVCRWTAAAMFAVALGTALVAVPGTVLVRNDALFFNDFRGQCRYFLGGSFRCAVFRQLGVYPALEPALDANPVPGVALRHLLGGPAP